jgi:hypothetical protein
MSGDKRGNRTQEVDGSSPFSSTTFSYLQQLALGSAFTFSSSFCWMSICDRRPNRSAEVHRARALHCLIELDIHDVPIPYRRSQRGTCATSTPRAGADPRLVAVTRAAFTWE